MVNFSHQLLQRCRYYYHQDFSILDLGVSYRFIAKISEKYLKQGLKALKLTYKGSKSFLTAQQKEEVKQWLGRC